jgi:hypothetical protein
MEIIHHRTMRHDTAVNKRRSSIVRHSRIGLEQRYRLKNANIFPSAFSFIRNLVYRFAINVITSQVT